jgi:hypothetical protein
LAALNKHPLLLVIALAAIVSAFTIMLVGTESAEASHGASEPESNHYCAHSGGYHPHPSANYYHNWTLYKQDYDRFGGHRHYYRIKYGYYAPPGVRGVTEYNTNYCNRH